MDLLGKGERHETLLEYPKKGGDPVVSTLSYYKALSPFFFVGKMFLINEISPASDPEWVELYTPETASLQNCTLYLHSTDDTKQKVVFTEDIKVENHFIVIKKGQYEWTSNWLNNSGDTVKIKCPSGEDSHSYEGVKGKVIGRSPDGTGNFFELSNTSEGSPNAPPTPSPTPKPTEVIDTETPDPTSIVLASETESSEPTPIYTPSETPEKELTRIPTIVTPAPSSTDQNSPEPLPRRSPVLPISLVGIGSLFMGVAALPFAKKIYNEKHASNKKIP